MEEPEVQDDAAAFYQGMAWVVVAYFAAFVAGLLAGHVVPLESPLWIGFTADVVGTLVIFGFSFFLRNSSIYDPWWSVAPIALVSYWSIFDGPDGNWVRKTLLLGLVAFWGTRLTSNWALGWQGLAHEDWRYVRIRQKTGRLYWPVSLLGIHLFPTLVVFLALWPAYAAVSQPGAWNWPLDVAAVCVCIGAALVEAASDGQLRAFRQRTHAPGAVIDEGFWRWSRHPNYLGEILFWWGVWLFAVAAHGSNAVTCIGAVVVAAMFRFVSIPMMEKRLLERHPAYRDTIAKVPMLLPWPPSRRPSASATRDEAPPPSSDKLVDERARLMLDTMPFVPPPDLDDDR